MSAEYTGGTKENPYVNLIDCFSKDFDRLKNERISSNEIVQLASNCLFINHFGYTVITSHRLFTVSFQPYFGLSNKPRELYGLGGFFSDQKIPLNAWVGGIGWAYRLPDKDLTPRQMDSRVINEIACKSIGGINIRNLYVLKKAFSFEKIVFTQIIPELLTQSSTLFEQPVFLGSDQATFVYKTLASNIYKTQ